MNTSFPVIWLLTTSAIFAVSRFLLPNCIGIQNGEAAWLMACPIEAKPLNTPLMPPLTTWPALSKSVGVWVVVVVCWVVVVERVVDFVVEGVVEVVELVVVELAVVELVVETVVDADLSTGAVTVSSLSSSI